MNQIRISVQQAQEIDRLSLASEVARGAAHDIRHTLGLVKNYVKLLDRDLPEDVRIRPEVEKDLKVIRDAVHQGEELASRLTTLGTTDSENQPLKLNDATRENSEIFLNSGLNYSYEFDPSDPVVFINRVDFQQILLNLIVNAKEAMPEGGKVTFRTRVKSDDVSLSVVDTGHGMDPETVERAGTPFFSTKEATLLGRGLGLTTVHRLMGNAGGYVDIRSELNVGTEVILHFPT